MDDWLAEGEIHEAGLSKKDVFNKPIFGRLLSHKKSKER